MKSELSSFCLGSDLNLPTKKNDETPLSIFQRPLSITRCDQSLRQNAELWSLLAGGHKFSAVTRNFAGQISQRAKCSCQDESSSCLLYTYSLLGESVCLYRRQIERGYKNVASGCSEAQIIAWAEEQRGTGRRKVTSSIAGLRMYNSTNCKDHEVNRLISGTINWSGSVRMQT